MSFYFHSVQQHGTTWYCVVWGFLLPGSQKSSGLAPRGLPLHCILKWRKAQSPVVSCTAVFTGASSLKTEDILKTAVTTFSTSDVSVWKTKKNRNKSGVIKLAASQIQKIGLCKAVTRIMASSWLISVVFFLAILQSISNTMKQSYCVEPLVPV